MNNCEKIFLGCVADDYTGASDVASFLSERGIKTVMLNGIPKSRLDTQYEAIVIALKTRTQEVKQAIEDTINAFEWLQDMGMNKLYFKYCSTFDSTSKGNIGPISDALLEYYNIKSTIVCPALPVNGRMVKDGNLYVNGKLLEDSHMRNHPLTPMLASNITKLMESQSKYTCINLFDYDLEKSNLLVLEKLNNYGNNKKHFYIVPDFYEEKHGSKIAELFWKNKLITGSSGLIPYLSKYIIKGFKRDCYTSASNHTPGNAIILSGSCSIVTLEQIEYYQKKGYVSFKIDPEKLESGIQSIDSIWRFIIKNIKHTVLLYSSDSSEKLDNLCNGKRVLYSDLLEKTMANIAIKSIEHGFKRIIVAGGETSGAITKALGYESFEIGTSISPGVPVLIPLKNKDIRFVLKSGNFGQLNFFIKALEETGRLK